MKVNMYYFSYKIVSCTPILEGYGLTETTAGMSITVADERTSGHVGFVT